MSLAGGDATDDATVTFLLSAALSEKKKEKEEEERRKREEELREEERKKLERRRAKALKGWDEEALWQLNRRIQAGSTLSSAEYAAWYFWDGGVSSSSSASGLVKRRKRKKKRKKRLPRTRCLRRGFTGDYAPRVMFPSGVARPKMLRILAGMDQKDCCSGICKAGFPGYITPRAVLWGMARLVLLVTVHLALCFLPCLQARDARHHGRYGPEGISRHVQGLVCSYLTMSLALCSSWLSQAQDARHHGRHGPQDSYVEVHRCSSWTRSLTCQLVCCEWRHGPDSMCLLILLVITHFALCILLVSRCVSLLLFSGPDARHHGRYEPEGQLCSNTVWILLGDDFYEFLYSALSLVRMWIHALRQSTVLIFLVCLRSQRSAWFDCGFMRCVSLRGFSGRISHVFLREGLRRPFHSAQADPHGPAF